MAGGEFTPASILLAADARQRPPAARQDAGEVKEGEASGVEGSGSLRGGRRELRLVAGSETRRRAICSRRARGSELPATRRFAGEMGEGRAELRLPGIGRGAAREGEFGRRVGGGVVKRLDGGARFYRQKRGRRGAGHGGGV